MCLFKFENILKKIKEDIRYKIYNGIDYYLNK